MIAYLCGLLVALWPVAALAAPGAQDTTLLGDLVREALSRSPEIESAREQMAAAGARILQESSLPPPELIFMREGMPSFRYADAMFSRVELMQMIPFPTKLSVRRDIAEIGAEHAHHDHMEKEFDVLYRLKSAYAELWYLQQSILLTRRNGDLLRQTLDVVRARYGAGNAGEEDVLKAALESARNDNLVVSLRQQELAAKSMIMGLLDRPEGDTLGTAVIPDSLALDLPCDTLIASAMAYRPMLQHDSLVVVEQKTMLSASRQEYIPDFRVGVQYMTAPVTGFNGWTVTAGITIPFAPWTLAARGGRIDESEAGVGRAAADLASARAMVRSQIRDSYSHAASDREQVAMYRTTMLPAAEHALRAALGAYGSGRGDLLMVLDASRTLRDLMIEERMLRMDFARSVAALEKEIGVRDLTYLR
ncbi:MAG TPA: TolC family protein [Bacteroidota bacterium]|nr:TolC family protein [Bacteroidota bacterium]